MEIENEATKVAVRRLSIKDLFDIAALVAICGKEIMDAIKDMPMPDIAKFAKDKKENKEEATPDLPIENKEEKPPEIKITEQDESKFLTLAITVFTALFKYAGDKIKPIFANLVGMTVEEFDKQPYDLLMDIIEKLAEQEDLPGFFTRAFQLGQKLFTKK